MNPTEKPMKRRESGNSSEASDTDAAALPESTGRDSAGTAPNDITTSVGARPRSEVTGRHDAGSGANETVDGLTSSEEAMRRGAEDTPLGAPDKELEDLPVFDRAGALPKV